MELPHLVFDIGGVLGTNGWDREQRARAIEHFELDDEFERRHGELVGRRREEAVRAGGGRAGERRGQGERGENGQAA